MSIATPAPPATRPNHARQALSILIGVLLVAVVALALAVAVVPLVVGGNVLTVLSGSMEPTLPVGSVVIIRPRPANTIKRGDIINFSDREPGSSQARVVTHRVAEVRPGPTFVTKGDANRTADPHPVAASGVHGVLWYDVPYIGRVREVLVGPAGLAILGGLVILLVGVRLLLPKRTSA